METSSCDLRHRRGPAASRLGLRNEGTSLHYLPASRFAEPPRPDVLARVCAALQGSDGVDIVMGSTWNADAPFRETGQAIATAHNAGKLAVEIEAAAL